MESLTIGYVYKADYFLPVNASNFWDLIADPFNPTPLPINNRRRREISDEPVAQQQSSYEKSERYTVEAEEIGEGQQETVQYPQEKKWYDEDEPDDYTLEDLKLKTPHNLGQSRFTLYKGIEKLAESSGMPGRPCLLRSICEISEAPFTYGNGILGELAHLIMT